MTCAHFECPGCGELTPSRVVNTIDEVDRRDGQRIEVVKRWRRCLDCGFKYPTVERVATTARVLKHRPAIAKPSLPFAS